VRANLFAFHDGAQQNAVGRRWALAHHLVGNVRSTAHCGRRQCVYMDEQLTVMSAMSAMLLPRGNEFAGI
jgi:hypothetical protein